MELYVTWLFVQRGKRYYSSSYGSSLSALFADLNLSLLQHSRNEHSCVSHTAEVGTAREHGLRSKSREGSVEADTGSGRESWQLQVDNALGHLLLKLGKLGSRELLHHVVDRNALIGQQYGHGVLAVAIRQFDGSKAVVVGIEELTLLMHHINLLDVACVALKVLQTGILLRELMSPRTIEVDGVEQYGNVGGIETVDYGRNHTVGLVGAPLIDMFESLWRREVEVLDISGILTAYGAGIGALELKALVEGYVVGDVDSGEFVAIGSHAERSEEHTSELQSRI